MRHIVYLSLGANIGNKENTIRNAIKMIGESVGDVTDVSSMIETEPWGFESENSFMNCAVRVETGYTPTEVLKRTQEIESALGRTHKTTNGEYKDRLIDIDILLYDDITVNLPELRIPHPLMHDRDFVMIPLREIYHKPGGN